MDAAYVLRVRFRLDTGEGVRASPEAFETTVERDAVAPGEPGWLFFRDHLWRGELNDEGPLRESLTTTLGVPVESVAFRELRTDREHLDALEAAIADELDAGRGTFGNAGSVERVTTNYLGSSVHVRPEET